MSELIEKLGIEASLLIAQVVNFTLLALILWKFAYKPVVTMLEKRRIRIEKSIMEAERIEKERIRMKREHTEIISATQKEAEKILNETRLMATALTSKLRSEAEVQASQIRKRAEEEILRMKQDAQKELTQHMANLVAQAVERVTKETVDVKKNEKIIEVSLKDLA